MNFLKSFLWLSLVAVLCLFYAACDDNTGTFGAAVMPESDEPEVSQAVFEAYVKSAKTDSLIAKTSSCYLGRVTDPETHATTTCNFLAQFYLLEGVKMPAREYMHKVNGRVACDSVIMRLYISSYYGDSLNSIKIGVRELDRENIMPEGVAYYTNIDAEKYVGKSPDAIDKAVTFSVVNLSQNDSLRYSSTFSRNVEIKLPVSYGSEILNKYYDYPEYFKNSNAFIRNVVPGFYFKTISGNGTIVTIDVSTLSVYYHYTMGDSTYVQVQRVAATEEVLQNNEFENSNIDDLINDESCAYLKTPAGIFAEVSLPVSEIYENHGNDSVNSAKIVFKRQNNDVVTKYSFAAPAQLMMIRKSKLDSFFANDKKPEGKEEYVVSFASDYNSYTFPNIANLISSLKRLRDEGAGVSASEPASSRKAKYQKWEAANPDWNKVLLVPVVSTTNSSGNITSVHHDFSLKSTKLLGGKNTPIAISVVYSHFK